MLETKTGCLRINRFVSFIFFKVIVYTVAALSVERYIDARAKLTAKCRLYITFTSLILIWTLGLLLPYPFVFYTFLYDSRSIVHPNETTTETKNQTTIPTVLMCRSILSENTLLIYEIVLYVTAFLIPYSIIVLFSLKLLRFLRDWLKRKEKLTHRRSSKRRTRGVKLVLCIVLSFLLCYTPFWTFKFYTSFLVDETIRNRPILRRFLTYAHQSVILLSYIEGILNPLFFIVLTERFSLTFSRHRSKHLNFLRSRSDEKRNSISAQLRNSKKRQCSRTTIGTGSTTIEKVDLNGLLLTNHHVLHETDSVPFNVSPSMSKEKNHQ